MTMRAVIVTNLWRERVLEQMGRDVDATLLARAIAWGIDNETGDVQYLGRVSRAGKRAYRFSFSSRINGAALVIADEAQIRFITVFESGWRIPREGKDSVRA